MDLSSSLQNFNPEEWMNRAIEKSCDDSSWKGLLTEVYASVKTKMKELDYSNFAQLTQIEQAIVIEKELFKVYIVI